MSPEDAVNQFYRIMANKPTEQTITFARIILTWAELFSKKS